MDKTRQSQSDPAVCTTKQAEADEVIGYVTGLDGGRVPHEPHPKPPPFPWPIGPLPAGTQKGIL